MKWSDQLYQRWMAAVVYEKMAKFLCQDLIPTVLMILFLAIGMVVVNMLFAA